MIFSYIVTFFCIWWIVFYMILPFAAEVRIKPKLGHADSAPTKPHLGIKFTITSIISIILTAIVMHIINQGIFIRFIEKYLSFLSNI